MPSRCKQPSGVDVPHYLTHQSPYFSLFLSLSLTRIESLHLLFSIFSISLAVALLRFLLQCSFFCVNGTNIKRKTLLYVRCAQRSQIAQLKRHSHSSTCCRRRSDFSRNALPCVTSASAFLSFSFVFCYFYFKYFLRIAQAQLDTRRSLFSQATQRSVRFQTETLLQCYFFICSCALAESNF